jgi:hypothetical protein
MRNTKQKKTFLFNPQLNPDPHMTVRLQIHHALIEDDETNNYSTRNTTPRTIILIEVRYDVTERSAHRQVTTITLIPPRLSVCLSRQVFLKNQTDWTLIDIWRGTFVMQEAKIMRMAIDMRAVGFDMDGVLFGTKMTAAVREVGVGASFWFVWKTWSLPTRTAFFDSLRVEVLRRDTNGMGVIHQGAELPSILTAWQCGFITGVQAE